MNECLDWHKQRATKFGANTVLITQSENMENYQHSGWTGNSQAGQQMSTIAEYYYCTGPKNITPK